MGSLGTASPELDLEYPIWRVWKATGTPLNEIRYEWTYIDLLKATALLDIDTAYDVAFSEAAKEEG